MREFNYQSDKYNQATATSEKIVVTFVADNTFEVKQDTNAQITVTFDAPVKALGEVTVNRLYKGFELPVLVDKATVAENGMSATITLFTKLVDKNEYLINIAGYETADFTASVGEPKTIAIYADQKAVDMPFEMVTIEYDTVTSSYKTVPLGYRLYDAAGVDVTEEAEKKGTVLFEAASYSTDGTYYVSGSEMWFADADVDVTVVAEYQSNEWKDGAPVCSAKTEKLFMSEKKPPVIVTGLADWKVAGTWDDAKKSVAFKDPAVIAVKLKLSEGDPVEATEDGDVADYGKVRFEELNPEVAALNGNEVVFFKQGTAKVIVYYSYVDGTEEVELPIAQLNIETTPEKALQSMELSKSSMVLGTVDKYDEFTIDVTAKDNYGNKFDFTKVEVVGLDDLSKAAMEKVVEDEGVKAVDFTSELGKITLYGKELMSAAQNDPAKITLNFKVKVDDKLEKTFSVTLKNRGADGTEYIEIESDGFGVDVARTAKDADTKAEKTATFTVYQYSNGIKVGTQEIQKYDASNITANAYYFKVTKDGTDVTDKVDISEIANGKVTIKFSKTKTDANGYEVVDYTDFGAGNYVFTLYKGKKTTTSAVPVQMKSAVGSVTCNVGSYGNAARKTTTLNGTVTEPAIRDAFTIKNAQGGDTTSAIYKVNAQGLDKADMKYVYVESITFYDEVANDVYAAYTVPVGFALEKGSLQ